MDSPNPSPSLNDCLKLLKGDRDEQKLAGLLLATKFCQGDDSDSILKVYNAVGDRFLNRLLMTGMGKLSGGVKGGEDTEAYLKLSVTVLAAFCRVSEIASLEQMISKVPIVSEIISKLLDPSIFDEGYEFLLLVASASEEGKLRFFKPGVMDMLAPHISCLQNGSQSLELAMRLLQQVFNKIPADMMDTGYISGMSCMVASIAKHFAVLHNALKFDALHLLTTLLSSRNPPLHDALRSMSNDNWASYIRVGIAAILQNRVVSTEKLQALLLAESMMSILGENWLLEQNKMHDDQAQLPVDKYLLLVLETARVEVAVLLNELAYLKYEASKSSTTSESILSKQRNLAVSFSLIEKIIKLISNATGIEGTPLSEGTITKVVVGLNETISLVLDFLQDSKEHGQRRGDDLLAAVRIVGSYLAETPFSCKEKTRDLLEYMFSIEGEDESSPFYSVCFLLPMLCQITMEVEQCKFLASFGGHKAVVQCLVKIIERNGATVENYGTILFACETILNFLLKREVEARLEYLHLVQLLRAMALWTENCDDPTSLMMASSICSVVFDLTSEDSLLNYSNFDASTLETVSQLIVKSFSQVEVSYGELDLHEIVISGYSRWADRFPVVRNAVESASKA